MPDAFGLYQAAGIESPGGHQGWMTGSVRSDDDWTLASLITNHSVLLAGELGCASPSDLPCLQALSTEAVYTPSKALRFAPALAVEGEVPLGLIAAGKWNKVPVIVGGQSCESCESAEATFGPYTRSGVSDARVRAGLLTHPHLPFSPALAPSRCSALDGLVEGFGLFQSTICFKLVNWERPQGLQIASVSRGSVFFFLYSDTIWHHPRARRCSSGLRSPTQDSRARMGLRSAPTCWSSGTPTGLSRKDDGGRSLGSTLTLVTPARLLYTPRPSALTTPTSTVIFSRESCPIAWLARLSTAYRQLSNDLGF
jgi:hypothetical protein